jgi:hypothetical protein
MHDWLVSAGKVSQNFQNAIMVKQSGFLCCWSFDDYMADGQVHSAKASRAFAHAAGIASSQDLKTLAARAAQHTSTAQQLGSIASKEL